MVSVEMVNVVISLLALMPRFKEKGLLNSKDAIRVQRTYLPVIRRNIQNNTAVTLE